MSKTALFTVSCSLIILALFGVSCYLMSIVNPPPIGEVVTEKTIKLGDHMDRFYLRNMPSNVLDYGIEKMHDPSVHSSPSHHHNLTIYIPTVKMKNPHLAKVRPPLWPPKTTASFTTSKELNITQVNEEKTNKTKESSIHRRSINFMEKNIDATGAVVLKIVDDDGKPRIEIKLNPNEFQKKKSRLQRNFIEQEKDSELRETEGYTEIKILPNDTVIVNNDNSNEDFQTNNSDVTIESVRNKNAKEPILHPTGFTRSITPKYFGNKTRVKTTTLYIDTVNEKIVSLNNVRNLPTISEDIVEFIRKNNKTDVLGYKGMFDNATTAFTIKQKQN